MKSHIIVECDNKYKEAVIEAMYKLGYAPADGDGAIIDYDDEFDLSEIDPEDIEAFNKYHPLTKREMEQAMLDMSEFGDIGNGIPS